jgi:hypothetical protein
MRHFIPVLTKRTALIGFAASVVFAAHSAQASSFNLTFIGQSVIPTGTQYEGTTVGGLSSITYDATNHSFYIISDDRSQINPARFYKTTIKLQFVHPLEPCVLKIKELFDKNLCQICIILNIFIYYIKF